MRDIGRKREKRYIIILQPLCFPLLGSGFSMPTFAGARRGAGTFKIIKHDRYKIIMKVELLK